jgi:hypothetical protein
LIKLTPVAVDQSEPPEGFANPLNEIPPVIGVACASAAMAIMATTKISDKVRCFIIDISSPPFNARQMPSK